MALQVCAKPLNPAIKLLKRIIVFLKNFSFVSLKRFAVAIQI